MIITDIALAPDTIRPTLDRMLDSFQKDRWQGFDPYDGLSSGLFQSTPLRHSRFFRLAMTHLCKRSPVNLRKLLQIQPAYNAKGVALVLSGCVKLYELTNVTKYKELSLALASSLRKNSLPGYHGKCWGYNWDWQSRAFFLPKFTPTIVVTSFAANALLDGYEILGDERFLEMARSSCDFISNDLNKKENEHSLSFSYSPLDTTTIHNASILGAVLLGRVYQHTREPRLKSMCQKAIAHVLASQNGEGSWFYGGSLIQRWVDNYHTGFIIEALLVLHSCLETSRFMKPLRAGLNFYKEYMFENDGAPRFYKSSRYPIEPHCSAQAIIVFTTASRMLGGEYLQFAEKIAAYTIEHLSDANGRFYYQKTRYYVNKICYMRWVQAWMFKALAVLLCTRAQG